MVDSTVNEVARIDEATSGGAMTISPRPPERPAALLEVPRVYVHVLQEIRRTTGLRSTVETYTVHEVGKPSHTW